MNDEIWECLHNVFDNFDEGYGTRYYVLEDKYIIVSPTTGNKYDEPSVFLIDNIKQVYDAWQTEIIDLEIMGDDPEESLREFWLDNLNDLLTNFY